jgi:hypothetical protein
MGIRRTTGGKHGRVLLDKEAVMGVVKKQYNVTESCNGYKVREGVDVEQTAGNIAGVGLGIIFELIFRAVFANKLTFGVVLFIAGVITVAAGAGGMGFLLILAGIGFGGLWIYRRNVTEPQMIEQALSHQAPAGTLVNLVDGERELLRIPRDEGNGWCVVTNARVVWKDKSGLTTLPISDIIRVVPEKQDRNKYVLHLYNRRTNDEWTTFITESQTIEMANAVHTAMVG